MIRWLGQRDRFRCVPIALVNVLKWLKIEDFYGLSINERLAKKEMTEICHAKPLTGAPIILMEYILKNLQIKYYIRKSKLNSAKVRKWIKNSKLLLIVSNIPSSHAFIISNCSYVKGEGYKYKCINLVSDGTSVKYVNTAIINEILHPARRPIIYIISPKDKKGKDYECKSKDL